MIITALDIDTRLVPQDQFWGPGFGDRDYPAGTLDEIAGYVAETTQPGYRRRLHTTSPGYLPGGGRCVIPPGYDALAHPNRAGVDPNAMDPEFLTSLDEPVQIDPGLQDYCRGRGWILDQHGRPLHPHHEQLLADPLIGLPTGLGYGHWYGEAAVVDAVVTVSSGCVLLVSQGRNFRLPGGYGVPADVGRTSAQWHTGDRPLTLDGILATAARKVSAETGVDIPRDAAPRIVRAIRPISSPHTLHAWTCTYTVHIALTVSPPPRTPDVPGATWHDGDQLLDSDLPRLWPDHRRALLAAID